MIASPTTVPAALSAGLLALLLTACSAGAERARDTAATGPGDEPAASAPATAPATTAAPTEVTAPSPTPAARVITLSYAGGVVSGDTGRQAVRLGEQVVIRVTSDVAEEVHVHGYDVTQAVPAGTPVDIALTASIPGGFEVELHDAGKALCQLRVA